MGDELVCSLDEKHLSNMRVVDLKQELDKRGLSKSGSKKDLVKRLKQQLQFEKLCEGATSVKANDSKLDLDEATEQNEFVQRYLAEKQKIYAEHKEAQRLIELREQQDSASSANEDVAEESEIRDISSSTQEANAVSCSVLSEQNVTVQENYSEESSTIEDHSSTKDDDDDDVSESVNVASEMVDSFMNEKEHLYSVKIHSQESTVSSVKFACDEGENTKGGVKIRMKIPLVDRECTLDIDKKAVKNLDEENNLPNTSSKSRHWNLPESCTPTATMESVPYPPIEYSLSDIQLPDAPGSKKAESKKNNEIISIDISKSPANGEECSATEVSHMEVDASNKCDEQVKSCETDLPVSDPRDNQVNESDLKASVGESLQLESKVEISSKTQPSEKTSAPVPDAETEIPEVQVHMAKREKPKVCPVADQISVGDTPVETKKIADESQNTSLVESHNKLRILKSFKKCDSHTEKGLEESSGPSHLSGSCDEHPKAVLAVESEKPAHRRKHHRTRRSSSSSHSSTSSDSSSISERDLVPSEKTAQSNSASREPSTSSRSRSHSKSPSENCDKGTLLGSVQKDPVINAPIEKRRMKINRNTVIKAESCEMLSKIDPIEISLIEKDTESMDHSGNYKTVDSAIEKDIGGSGETTQTLESSRVMKFTRRKMTIASQRASVGSEESSEARPCVKKRKWGNCAAALSQTSLSISSDSLKTLIPDIKPLVEAPVMSDLEDLSPSIPSEALSSSPPRKEPKLFNLPLVDDAMEEDVPEKMSSPAVKERSLTIPEVVCSPPHNPTSSILFITNLVRPFTLLQLKDLLKQTGTVVEENFWIDKIKSKCFVMYENEEQAVTTRAALHGLRWPSSNPKILSVDFATQEELDVHKTGSENLKPAQLTLLPVMERLEPKKFPILESPKKKEREERKKDKERHRITVTHVREWDKDKLTQDSPERIQSQHLEKDGEKSRNAEKKKEKKESKRRQDDDAPAKLLDDLFRKTKASPCIYWLPLTEEQAKKREEERQARRLERERWRQQQKEQEETERKNRMKGRSAREKENRRSQSRSRSPPGRRR